MHRRLIVFSVIGAMAFLAGCGDDDDGSVKVSDGRVKVSATDYALSPANPAIDKTVVEFEVSNDGKVAHALEVEGSEGEVETDAIDPGKSATLKADFGKPGRYSWYCPLGDHKERGMKGEITVAGGGGDKEDNEAGSDGHGGY